MIQRIQHPAERQRMNRLRLGATTTLVLYWISLFVATHIPIPPNLGIGDADKLFHFLAYAGLAGLTTLTVALWARQGLAAWHLAAIVVGLSAFGAFDELTQPLANRHADWYDWYADVAGVVAGTIAGALVYGAARMWTSRAIPSPRVESVAE